MAREKIMFAKGTLHQQDFKTRRDNYFDMAEQRLEYFCKDNGFNYKKLMFNQDEDWSKYPIGSWHSLGLLKYFPDYFIYKGTESAFVELKNSPSIKQRDLKAYIAFDNQFCNDRDVKYLICFPSASSIKFKTIDEILDMLTSATIDHYHEGYKVYKLKL